MLWSCARRNRRAFDQIVFEDGLHRLDERRGLPFVLRLPRMVVAGTNNFGTPRHRSCTADPVPDEARRWLRGLAFVAPCPHRKCRAVPVGGSRRWSAVSQRVPRDAHQRFVLADVLDRRHRIPGEEMPCRSSGPRISEGTPADNEKPQRPERRLEKKERPDPDAGTGQGFVTQSCRHGVRFNGRGGTRFDSLRAAPTASRRKRRSKPGKGPTRVHTHRKCAGTDRFGRSRERARTRAHVTRNPFEGEDAVARVSATRAAGSE